MLSLALTLLAGCTSGYLVFFVFCPKERGEGERKKRNRIESCKPTDSFPFSSDRLSTERRHARVKQNTWTGERSQSVSQSVSQSLSFCYSAGT